MPDATDMDLVRSFARNHSEAAFAELVRRHLNLVYSVALRYAGRDGDAQDIAQAVFIILARKAGGLRAHTVLTGWLYETTRFTAARWQRANARRLAREQEAHMQSLNSSSTDVWEQLAPHLEAAMSQLREGDRTLLALRFYENKTGSEAAVLMGIREAAAHKRTARALEKLRKFFSQRGMALTAATIAGAVSAHSVQAAPTALTQTITAVAAAKGTAATTSTLTLVKGALKIMAWTKAKLAIGIAAGIVLAAGTTTVTVNLIEDHRAEAWQINEGFITPRQFEIIGRLPPQVKILPSKFHKPAEAGENGTGLGTGLRAKDIVAFAYGYNTPARAVLSADLPATRYDFIASLRGEPANEKALQVAVRQAFGVVARTETRTTGVWLLKVKAPNAPGLKLNPNGGRRNSLFPSANMLRGRNEPIGNLAVNLEYMADFPIIDQTGLTNRFDFDLNCGLADLELKDLDAINGALGELGLELVPTNLPIDMLVVEKAN
jgi:uncharacterized protein (TIGR03435 family)